MICSESLVLTSAMSLAFLLIASAFVFTLLDTSVIEASTDCKSAPRAAIDAVFVAMLLFAVSKAAASP